MEWLNKLVEMILSVFPRIKMIQPNESGVRITGAKFTVIGPGVYVYWPMIQAINWLDIQPQVVDLKNQSLTTEDGKSVVISAAIEYTVADASKALLKVFDHDASVRTLALGILADHVTRRSFAECRDIAILKSMLRKGLNERVADWGIKIEKAYITDFTEAQHIRVFTDAGENIRVLPVTKE